MAKNPSSIFYWNDWTSDLELKKCSRAAQGFWMALLALAAAAKPKGYVIVGDKPCTVDDLVRLLGDDKRKISRWLRELETNGVFSRGEDGTIFCRRMVRDSEKRVQARTQVRHKSATVVPQERPALCQDKPDKPLKSAASPKKTHARARALQTQTLIPSESPKTLPVFVPTEILCRARAREGPEQAKNTNQGFQGRWAGDPHGTAAPPPQWPKDARVKRRGVDDPRDAWHAQYIEIGRRTAFELEAQRLSREAQTGWRESRGCGGDPPGDDVSAGPQPVGQYLEAIRRSIGPPPSRSAAQRGIAIDQQGAHW